PAAAQAAAALTLRDPRAPARGSLSFAPRLGALGRRRVDPAGAAAEVEVGDLGVGDQLGARALEAVLAQVEHVAAIRQRQRAARLLLDDEHGDAVAVDLDDLLEDRVDE